MHSYVLHNWNATFRWFDVRDISCFANYCFYIDVSYVRVGLHVMDCIDDVMGEGMKSCAFLRGSLAGWI